MEPTRRTRRSRLRAVVPNSLSLVRVALGIAFFWIPSEWRLAAFLVAGVSDFLDGAASRWLNVVSYTGRVLDPLADKAFAIGVVATLIYEDTLKFWEFGLLGLREIAVFVGVVWLLCVRDWAAFRRLPPSMLGKLTSVGQFLYIIGILLEYQSMVLLAVTAVLSGLAGLHYSWLFLQRRWRSGSSSTGR